MLSGKWENKTDLIDLVGLIFRETGMNNLLALSVTPDLKNNTNYVLEVLFLKIKHNNISTSKILHRLSK